MSFWCHVVRTFLEITTSKSFGSVPSVYLSVSRPASQFVYADLSAFFHVLTQSHQHPTGYVGSARFDGAIATTTITITTTTSTSPCAFHFARIFPTPAHSLTHALTHPPTHSASQKRAKPLSHSSMLDTLMWSFSMSFLYPFSTDVTGQQCRSTCIDPIFCLTQKSYDKASLFS